MTPRDYFAKGWPGDDAIVESVPMHSTDGDCEMFSFVNLVAEGGVIVAKSAASTSTPESLAIAVDDYDAYDVKSAAKLPVWTNIRGKIIVTPKVDTSGLAVGDEMEVKSAGSLQKKGSQPAVAKCLEITADNEVRLLVY